MDDAEPESDKANKRKRIAGGKKAGTKKVIEIDSANDDDADDFLHRDQTHLMIAGYFLLLFHLVSWALNWKIAKICLAQLLLVSGNSAPPRIK